MRGAVWRLIRLTGRSLRGRDLALHAAAVTFYAGVAVVPVALLTTWLAGLFGGAQRVRRLAAYPIEEFPAAIGADRALAALLDAGLHLTPALALAALLPATFYGEGLRRAFVSLDGSGGTLVGWRGRLLLLPLLAAGPGLLLALLAAMPPAVRLLGRGGWAGVAGVVLSFLATWLVLTPVVTWVFRAVAPGRLPWLPTILGASFTAANVSGFLHGFVLFCSLPLDLGLPFGGIDVIGAMVAVGLWLFVFHVIVLTGFVATRELGRWRDPEPPGTP
jgi:membrane protein